MPSNSLGRRAFIAITVLGTFYVVTATLALALLPLPVLVIISMKTMKQPMALLALFACCWIPAYGLIAGLLGVRPPKFEPPGRELVRAEAPALFAMIDELATSASTAPPAVVYVSARPTAFVCETGGGFFGANSQRVLCIGAPLLAMFTVGELRSVIAHELGHYAGGDTRLSGVLAYTEGAFGSVLRATERDGFKNETIHWTVDMGRAFSEWLGSALVKLFAKIYLKLTRPMSRQQELAADVLSAQLAGRETAIRALEHVHVLSPLYNAYVVNEIAPAVDAGAMPIDLFDGFLRFRAAHAAHGRLAELTREVVEEKTDPFDTHPALAERVAALRALPAGPEPAGGEGARSLLGPAFNLDDWVVEATFDVFANGLPPAPVPRMTWRQFELQVLPEKLTATARDNAAKLFPMMPHAQSLGAMFGSVVGAYEAGRMLDVVAAIEPKVHQLVVFQKNEIVPLLGVSTLTTLFHGALLERGAVIEDSLGERSYVFTLGNEVVRPGAITTDALKNDVARAELARWAALLAPQQVVPQQSRAPAEQTSV